MTAFGIDTGDDIQLRENFSWFGNFRRIVVRYEHQVCMYEAFIQIACIMIVIKRL